MKKIQILVIIVFVFCAIKSNAQTLLEDDLPFTFLSWHYSNYPGATENQWTRIEKNSEEYLFVDFTFEGKNLTVTYTPNGQRIKARTKFNLKEIPGGVDNFLTGRFDKYKINEFMRIDLYEGSKVSDLFYSTKVKVKKENYVYYFDQDFNRIKDPTATLLSSL